MSLDSLPFNHHKKIINSNYYEKIIDEVKPKQEYIKSGNREIKEARETAWQSQCKKPCYYSNKLMPDNPFTQTILEIKEQVEKYLNVKFDSVLINHYRNGNDGMGFHADEIGVSVGNDIAIVSIGHSREFIVRNNESCEKYKYIVEDGDIFHMFNDCQKKFKHSIPRNKNDDTIGPRISITFRQMDLECIKN
jgi:alkylated DNA repair dioxygenase AlkB